MIQRIQSIYLLLSVAFLGLLAIFPFANSQQSITDSFIFNDQTFDISDHIVLLITFGMAVLCSFGAIFLFKNRPLQMRIVNLSVIALLFGIGVAIGLLYQDQANFDTTLITPQVGVGLPILSIVLTILAVRAIKKDDNLVKSSNRLR